MKKIIRKLGAKKAAVLFLAITASLMAGPARAAEGWVFTGGVGVLSTNVYVGSDDSFVVPLPTLTAEYSKGAASYSVSVLEGLTATYYSEDYGLLGSLNLTFGNERDPDNYYLAGISFKHSDKTRRLLEGTPSVSSAAAVLNASLQYPTAYGVLGASLGYHPTTVDHRVSGLDDDFRNGLILSLQYAKEVALTDRLSLAGFFSFDIMNKGYADAWYSLDRSTATLGAFEADAGPHDVQFALHAVYTFSERVGMSLDVVQMVLLGEARKSPYTVEQNQLTAMLQLYRTF